MKIINIDSLDTKINIPIFINKYGYGTLENKIKILLKSIYGEDIPFTFEDTNLPIESYKKVVWDKQNGGYYLVSGVTNTI